MKKIVLVLEGSQQQVGQSLQTIHTLNPDIVIHQQTAVQFVKPANTGNLQLAHAPQQFTAVICMFITYSMPEGQEIRLTSE